MEQDRHVKRGWSYSGDISDMMQMQVEKTRKLFSEQLVSQVFLIGLPSQFKLSQLGNGFSNAFAKQSAK